MFHGRMRGRPYRLEEDEHGIIFDDGAAAVRFTGPESTPAEVTRTPRGSHVLDLGIAYTMMTLLKGITSPSRVHQVNIPLLAEGIARGST